MFFPITKHSLFGNFKIASFGSWEGIINEISLLLSSSGK